MKHRKLKNSELQRLSPEGFKEAVKISLVVILDNIRSLNNIGSVFRTADAFLIKKVFLCGITATPPHRDIHKTALGATESVDWEYRDDCLELVKELQSEDVRIISIEQAENSKWLHDIEVEPDVTYAVIFGNEVKGVQQEIVSQSDLVAEIPQYGTKHSLNISVSAGIVCWDLFLKLNNVNG